MLRMMMMTLTMLLGLAGVTGRAATVLAGGGDGVHQVRHLYASSNDEPKMSSEYHHHQHHPLTYYYTNDHSYQHQPYHPQQQHQHAHYHNRALLEDKGHYHHQQQQPVVRYHHLMHKDPKSQHRVSLLPTMLLLTSLPSILISLLTSPMIISLLLQILKQLMLIQTGLVINPNALAVPASKLASKQKQLEVDVHKAIVEGKMEFEH